MRQFCWGESGYSAIVRDFGRYPIQNWIVHQLVTGPASYSAARSLTVKSVPLPANTAPSHGIETIASEFLATATGSTVARVAAINVTTWTVTFIELSTREADECAIDATTYEVLHVSTAA
ncbi:hypothetical protein FRC0535_00019 [Corynebacterium diphtheriae]|nr:hypothetical protein FRC0535_00019 [Corynebacterium diphtheriae]